MPELIGIGAGYIAALIDIPQPPLWFAVAVLAPVLLVALVVFHVPDEKIN